MTQLRLTSFERHTHMKITCRAQFTAEMAWIVPWAEVATAIEPVSPKMSEIGGRPTIALGKMLRIDFVRLSFNLSDSEAEDTLCGSASMSAFVGIDPGEEVFPDEATNCNFRRLIEKNKLGKPLLLAIDQYLPKTGSRSVAARSSM
jgi:Transposase domain (DUF772)